jgi:hypothetical protein
MRSRWLAVAWIAVGVCLWAGIFALYVDYGVQYYLREHAEYELGLRAEPSMAGVMESTQARGALHATVWTLFIVGAGWTTIALSRRGPSAGTHRARTPPAA